MRNEMPFLESTDPGAELDFFDPSIKSRRRSSGSSFSSFEVEAVEFVRFPSKGAVCRQETSCRGTDRTGLRLVDKHRVFAP